MEIAQTNSHDVTLSTPQAYEGSGVEEIPLPDSSIASLTQDDTVLRFADYNFLGFNCWALQSDAIALQQDCIPGTLASVELPPQSRHRPETA
jgi:hypothetical protein